MYSPTLGRWVQQDPAGYVDGMSPYEAERSSPIVYSDASGLYVNASIQGNAVIIEAGITLWTPRNLKLGEAILYTSGVKASIERGLAQLQAANPFSICAEGTRVNPLAKPPVRAGLYPIRWTSKVNFSTKDHSGSKPGNSHYVEVKRNGAFFGFAGPENSFSPSISTHNNHGGWGVWSYKMGMSDQGGEDDAFNAWWAAHETLHFAGLWDKYSWITGQPNEGYYGVVGKVKVPNNIMAGALDRSTYSYDLEKPQIETILRDRLWESNKWRLGPDYSVVGPR